MIYTVDNNQYEVIITRKNNKNTYIRVKEDLKIYVDTSHFTTKIEIKKLLDKNQEYLLNMINKQKNKLEKQKLFYYLGNQYNLIIMPSKEVELYNDKIFYNDDKSLEKWLKKQTENIFNDLYLKQYNLFHENIDYPKLRIRKMTTRWGVANKKSNTVTLNSLLIKYNEDIINFVIIHELSHFVHFNHSKKFWTLVEQYDKNYKKHRKELKE